MAETGEEVEPIQASRYFGHVAPPEEKTIAI